MDKKVFISHSKLDKSIAELICTALESDGIGCWIAPRDIPYGNDWAGEITNAIEASELFVFILSENSNSSRQCPKELTIADNIGLPVICVKIDDVEMNATLKYHLSMNQIIVMDVSTITAQLVSVVNVIRDKLNCQVESKVPDKHYYNVDEQLTNKFEELFGVNAKKADENLERMSVEGKLKEITTKNFIVDFIEGVERLKNAYSKKNQVDIYNSKKRISGPLANEAVSLQGKHFSIPNMEGVKTLVFQVQDDIIDYATKSRYKNCVLLESYNDVDLAATTYFPNRPPKCGSHIIVLHFDNNDNRVFVNMGILYNDKLNLSKSPLVLNFQKLKTINSTVFLSDIAYDCEKTKSELYCEQEISQEGEWLDAEIKAAPIIVIDPKTAEPVLRKVYYDEKEQKVKAQIFLVPQKEYFAFTYIDKDTGLSFSPLNNIEQATFYRKGIYGFPKDIMKAAELLNGDDSDAALFQISLLFKEKGAYHDVELYREYLLKAANDGYEDAVVELALSIAFDEFADITMEKVIEMLEKNINDESCAANFVLGFLLENKQPPKAFKYYLNAARNDYYPAINRLNCEDYTLNNCSDEDLFNCFMQSLNENNGLSECCMGCACFFGYDIEPRKEIGFNLIKSSAYLGDKVAQHLLVDIYDDVEDYKDKKQVLFWLEKIACYDTSVIVDLENRYIYGIGCEQSPENDKKAFNLLSLLEDSDDRIAINNLAWLYKNGRGCEQNYEKAKELFERSAEMGSAASHYHLGTIYEEGLGTDVDLCLAKKMYTIAAEKGHKKASERLECLHVQES